MQKDIKVLLLNPYIGPFQTDLVYQARSVCQPLSLGIIAQFLRESSIPFELLDANALGLESEAVIRYIEDKNPGVILTTTTHDIDYEQPRMSLRDIENLASCLDPSIRLIIMGTHGTVWPERTIHKIPNVSVVIRGEPEITAREVLVALCEGEDISGILGISYVSENGEVRHNPDRPYLEDLDELPLPAFELMPMDRYVSPYRNTFTKSAAIITSRGCPNGCYFCCTHLMGGRKQRVKSIDRVLEEISVLVKLHQVEFIHFIDDTFNHDYHRVRDLGERLIKETFCITWNAQMVLPKNDDEERLFKELIPLMKEAGCAGMSVGLEAVPFATRKHIPKSDPERFLRLYEVAKENGILFFPNNMFGLIGETEETLMEQDEFFARYGGVKRFHRSITIPRPGTKLYDKALQEGLIISEHSWEQLAGIAGQVGNELTEEDLIKNISRMDELEREYKTKAGLTVRKKVKN